VISPVRDATDTANRAALEGRAGPGSGNFGLEIIRDGSTFTAGSANSTPNQCGDPVDVLVPLRPTRSGYSAGRRQIRIRTTATDGTRDDDNLIFVCRPSTCGDGVVQHTHETCDDGNRIDGDGCDRGCQSENPNGLTPTHTPSKTPTPTPSSSPTITPTPTFTLEPGAPTYTPVTPSVTPTNTPTITLTFTPTSTPTATPVRVRCNIASGSGVIVPTSFGNATGALTGYQDWVISGPDANGVREIEIPIDGMSFGCGVLNAPIVGAAGVFCVRPDYESDPGYGYIDCNGGNLTGYNTRFEFDHNTNGNASGHPYDPECDDCSTSPDGQESCAKLEDAGSNDPYHAGVCNGPIVASESDPFPANGMVLIQRLIARLRTDVTSCSPNPCPAPDAPFGSGDLRVTGKLTTGTSTGVIYNYNNGTGTQTWNVTNTTRTCSQVLASSLTNLQVGLALPFPDLNSLIGDGRIQLRIKCN
jgi:cysteine-rich repeat protein